MMLRLRTSGRGAQTSSNEFRGSWHDHSAVHHIPTSDSEPSAWALDQLANQAWGRASKTAWCDPFLLSFSASSRGVLPEEFFAEASAPHLSKARTISALFSWTATCKAH